MPLSAIIVSRDRAAQLDLLLRSVTCNAPDLVDSISVLYCYSNDDFRSAYHQLMNEHPDVDFYAEGHFRDDVTYLVEQADSHVMFLTDDSYFYREMPELDPCAVLDSEPEVLCFSLRLGQNTGICYPLKGRLQGLPAFEDVGDYLVWSWMSGDADFGYPGSLDGHIFRKKDMLSLIQGSENWWNPNTLEDALMHGVYRSPRMDMACLPRSVLVGIPANRTSVSHPGNRYGERHNVSQEWLNMKYLEGHRIQFPNIHRDAVVGAHQEMGLEMA